MIKVITFYKTLKEMSKFPHFKLQSEKFIYFISKRFDKWVKIDNSVLYL
jgi:hypothetical protein